MEINVIGEMEAKSKLRFEEGRYAEAVRLYTIMSVFEPNNPEHHCQRSACWSKMGQYTAAIRSAEAAMSLDPGYATAQLRLAFALVGGKEWMKAHANFKSVLQLHPEHHGATGGLAVCASNVSSAAAATAAGDGSRASMLRPEARMHSAPSSLPSSSSSSAGGGRVGTRAIARAARAQSYKPSYTAPAYVPPPGFGDGSAYNAGPGVAAGGGAALPLGPPPSLDLPASLPAAPGAPAAPALPPTSQAPPPASESPAARKQRQVQAAEQTPRFQLVGPKRAGGPAADAATASAQDPTWKRRLIERKRAKSQSPDAPVRARRKPETPQVVDPTWKKRVLAKKAQRKEASETNGSVDGEGGSSSSGSIAATSTDGAGSTGTEQPQWMRELAAKKKAGR